MWVFYATMSHILESFLRNRSSLDHEATAMMKAEFMSLWDGLDTSLTTQVQCLFQRKYHTGLVFVRQQVDILLFVWVEFR